MSIRLSFGNRASVAMKLGETALVARYAQEAKEASESAKAASSHPPIIGGNGNWQIWNQGSGAYVDSGLCAVGPAGEQGPQGEAGNYTKPAAGIPEEDLSQTVRDKLNSGGTSDYADLNNKPGINSVTLSGNKTAAQLGLAAAGDVPTKTSQLQNDAGFLTQHQSLAAYRTAAAQDVIDAGKETAGLGLTGASVGDLVRVAAVDANGKPTSWSHVPLCDIVTNPNLLDNWYFVGGGNGSGVFPINQRGLATYPNAGYGIDRWFILVQGTVTLSADGISISNAEANQFRQIIDHPEKLAGKTVTISMLGDSNYAAIELRYDRGLIKNKLLDSTGFAYITCVIPDNPTGLYCSIYTRSTSTNKIKAVKLELGAEQTLAHWDGTAWVLNEIPDYSEELTKCMYYYQRFSTNGVSLGYGSMQTARRASIPVIFPSMMKTPYSFVSSGNAGITYSGGGPIPTLEMNAGTSAMAEIYATLPGTAADGNVGECVNLWLRSGAYLEFSAE